MQTKFEAAGRLFWESGCIGLEERAPGHVSIATRGLGVPGVTNSELAKAIVDTWLGARFDGGRSVPKVNRIKEYEDCHQLSAGDRSNWLHRPLSQRLAALR